MRSGILVSSQTTEYRLDQSHEHKAQQLARLGYLLLFFGALFGFTALVGAIISHSRLREITSTVERSHLIFQLYAFWFIVVILIGTLLFANNLIATGLSAALAIWLTTLIYGTTLLLRQLPVPLFSNSHS